MGMEITTSTSMGAVAYKHDKRLTISKNVNQELISDNITLIDKIEEYQKEWKPKTWTDEKGKKHTEPRPTSIGGWMRRIIDERMQPYMDQWNDKKRKDRQTNKTYTQWHDDQRKKSSNKKGDLFYEFTMQMGSKDDLGGLYYELQRQLAADPENEELKEQYNDLRTQFVETYKKWLDDIQEKYGLTVMYAFVHFDEGFRETPEGEVCGTPHMHVCVCPITDQSRSEFRKGPAVQVSMNKVMEAAGVERMALRSDISDIQQEMEQVVGQEFKDKESYKHAYQLGRFFIGYRETQEQDARNLGYEIKAPSQEKRKHERPEQYIINKELKKQGQRLMEQNQELKEENQDLEEQRNQADQEISSKEKAIKIADAKIQQKKDEIASLDSQAESSTERRNRAIQEEVQVNDRIRAATNQLAAKEAELGVMMAATMNEEIKQEKIYKQSLNALPGRNALGMIKVDKDNFGQESLSVNKGVYNSLKNYRDTMNSGFEEMRKADAVGKEVVKHLEDLVSNQEQHITREAQRIAAVSLQEDKSRFLKNRDKEKQLNNREAELQAKEAELLQREAELADIIKQGISEALRSVDISDLTKSDRFMEYLNQNYESTITRALADFNAIEEIRSKKAQEQVKKQTQGDSTDDHEWD